MKKLSFFACSAFAALMFAACGEDSVSGVDQPVGGNGGQSGPVAVLDSSRNMSLDLKGCYGHPYDALMKSLAPSNAYLVIDEAGHHVVIPNIEEACGYADIVFNNQRVLDTLKINFVGDPTDCMCVTDDWFNIDPVDADIKYLVYQNTVYVVVTEPLPVRSSSSSESLTQSSSSIEVASSSSVVESSSSVTPELSSSSVQPQFSSSSVDVCSSSVTPPDPSHVIVTDATAYCRTTSNIDPMLDGASGVADRYEAALPPVAYRYVGGTRTGFTLENILMTCNVEIEEMEVYESEGVIYVKPKLDYTNAQRCLCESRLQFSLPVEAIFYTAKYLVLDDGSSVNFQNKMEIYDMDVITVDEASAF